jgi:hypothetical protein
LIFPYTSHPPLSLAEKIIERKRRRIIEKGQKGKKGKEKYKIEGTRP